MRVETRPLEAAYAALLSQGLDGAGEALRKRKVIQQTQRSTGRRHMNTASVARIEQICCLGLTGQVFIPALLGELHACIPSSNNMFHWVDENLRVVNTCSERPPELLPLYLNEFLNKRECEAFPGTSEMLARRKGAYDMRDVAYENYYRSTIYNELSRPAGFHHLIAVPIRENGQALGLLALGRGIRDAEFQEQDKTLLDRLAPFVAHGLHNATPVQHQLVEHPESGLIILDREKRVQLVSQRARHLLFLCNNPQITSDSAKGAGLAIPPELGFVVDRLKAIYRSSTVHAPPVWQHQNPWGGFIFRAHWLDAINGPDTGEIGVTIQYQEPLALKAMRLSKKLALSPKQVQVCALLCAGYSYQKIAQHQQVSYHTVTDHVRKLFAKLAVTNRGELVAKLLAA